MNQPASISANEDHAVEKKFRMVSEWGLPVILVLTGLLMIGIGYYFSIVEHAHLEF